MDIYIDGARFLPDNVTISRVTLQVLKADYGDALKEFGPPFVARAAADQAATAANASGAAAETTASAGPVSVFEVSDVNGAVSCPLYHLRQELRSEDR